MTLKRQTTEILIEKARELLKPTPVRLNHVPRWLVQRIRSKLSKPTFRYPSAEDYLCWAMSGERFRWARWLDHWGSTLWYDGCRAFVSEPYLSIEGVQNAIEFAKKLDLDLIISANSWWFPGHTIRLLFELPEEERPK